MQSSLFNLVNTLQGTNSRREFSTGNTSPMIGTPRGMTYWTLQTTDGRFTFDRAEEELHGIRATHAPSPWMGDYGHFDLMPVVGPILPTPEARATPYNRDHFTTTPDQCQVELLRYGVTLRLAASPRCAIFEMQFPQSGPAAIVLQTGAAEGRTHGDIAVRKLDKTCEILGVSHSNHGGCPDAYGCYFVAEICSPALEVGVIEGGQVLANVSQHSGPRAGGYARVATGAKVSVRIGTSFISHDQARLNLKQEIGSQSTKEVASATRDKWSQWMSKVQVQGGTDEAQRCFASAMYRVGLFPMIGHEPDGKGGLQHRSPYDGQVHSGRLSVNNGFWDTHRTVYPLLALIDPQGYGEIIDGFLQAYRHAGWLPKWASPGFRDCMVSSHIDAVVSEAVLRGIPGFDHHEAYHAVRRNAFDVSDDPTSYGRLALKEYDTLGYVPAELAPYSVSRTLDYSHCDWCLSQTAQELGYGNDAIRLAKRSKNYRNLWYASAQLMRPKLSDGSWQEPWDAFSWGDAYIEGSAWQHSFNVPHDPQGLAELFGSEEATVEALGQLMKLDPKFQHGSYGETIHEMAEMAAAKDMAGDSFGQYAHSNQPVHSYLWLAAALGRPDWTTRQVDRVMRALYTPENLPGDEDNGEMSAWFILAAMGQFPLCPGSGQMVAAPCSLFDEVTWKQPDGVYRRIDAGSRKLQPNSATNESLAPAVKRSPM